MMRHGVGGWTSPAPLTSRRAAKPKSWSNWKPHYVTWNRTRDGCCRKRNRGSVRPTNGWRPHGDAMRPHADCVNRTKTCRMRVHGLTNSNRADGTSKRYGSRSRRRGRLRRLWRSTPKARRYARNWTIAYRKSRTTRMRWRISSRKRNCGSGMPRRSRRPRAGKRPARRCR